MSVVDLPVVRRVLASSLVDSLTAPHGVDRYLELIDPGLAVHAIRGRVVAVERTTPTTATITLAVNAAWPGHRAGQFVRVGATVDGTTHTRCYSVETPSTAAGATTISLSIGEVAGGTLSPHLVRDLRPGDTLRLSPPEGTFTLPDDRGDERADGRTGTADDSPDESPDHLILLGAGTGITPLMGMVRTLCADGRIDRADVTVVAYAASPEHQLHRAELADLAERHPRLRVAFGCTDAPGTGDLDGLFTPDHLDAADPDWRHAEVYACGSQPFMAGVAAATDAAGRREHLHTEAFAPTLVTLPDDDTTGTVAFSRSGGRAEDVTTSILEAAEAAGLTPAHGCRMGICHTCTRPKEAGCVRNLITGEVSGPEAADIQICVSAPVGDVVIDL